MQDWSLVKEIDTSGPGFFLRSHAGTPYLWADVFTGEHKGEMHIIDKQSLEVVKVLVPEPGKTVAHTEFTKDGDTGAGVDLGGGRRGDRVYDAANLTEVMRLPMASLREIQCLEQDQL
jgi:hypothetical protein